MKQSTLSYDLKTGFLLLSTDYEKKDLCASCGFNWDSDLRSWVAVFTMSVVEEVQKRIPDVVLDKSVEERIPYQKKREYDLFLMRKDLTGENSVLPDIESMKIQPFPYQKVGINYAVKNGKGMLIGCEMGLGKGLVLGTQVLTSKGPVKIESVQVGDFVIGRNGKNTMVTGVFPQPVQDVYKVTFNDGFSITVDGAHLWEVSENYQEKSKSIVLSTNQLLDKDGVVNRTGIGHNKNKIYKKNTYYIKDNGDSKWCIPIVSPIEFEEKKVDVDPYLLGVFLGDGHINKTGRVQIQMLSSDLNEMNLNGNICKNKKTHMKTVSFCQYKEEIVKMGLSGKNSPFKFIPAEYKYNSIEIRLKILQGLMDTDGHASVHSTEFCTTSKKLCDDVCEIVQSLGGIARVGIKEKPSYWYKGEKKYGKPAYRVNIKLPPTMQLFGLSRKIADHNVCSKYIPARYIMNIEKQDKQEQTICISVDAPDQLYVAEHCIVTHNTNQAIGVALELKRLRKINSCIVVTPASLKYNWPLEIEKFTNEKCVVIDGKDKDARLKKWLDDSCFFKIVNYELLARDIFEDDNCKRKKGESEYDYADRARKHAYRRVKLLAIKNRIWDIAIFDEIHFCKHFASARHRACKALKAKVKIGLSGTPMDGRLEEIFNVMNIIAPGLLGSRDDFYMKHIITDLFGQVKGYRNIEGLKKTIAPFFIRRLKKDVLKQLPPKIYDTKIVSLTDEEMKYYDAIKTGKHISVLVEDKLTREMVSADPMVIAIRLKQFCNMPQFIEPRCKTHSKLDLFLEMMEELVAEEAHKAIIFSQYKEMVDVIDKSLKKAGYKFLRIDGDTDTRLRASMQEQFNTDKTIDCIIGTEAMSTGLNLTGADIVINYDDNWQPAIMSQRSDRAHRILQTKTCFIYSFICKNTIEERIRGVLYAKDKISSDVMGDDSDEAVLRRLSKEEMRKVL